MVCQKCGKNQATTYYQHTINGKTASVQLCGTCASEIGVAGMFNHSLMGDMFAELLTNTFNVPSVSQNKLCEKCHSSLREIMNSGKVGCDECYQTFGQELFPTIENIHGKSHHIGKISASADSKIKKRAEMQQLQIELTEAIARQEFEKAAELRDQINSIDGELN